MEDNTQEYIPEELTFKEFKKEVKALGYNFKTFSAGGLKFFEVYNKEKQQINTQITTKEFANEHHEVLRMLNYYRNMIYTEENEKVIF